jgi:hypothetical protein
MTKSAIALAGCLALLASSADAAVITFEGQSNTIYSAPIERLGFDIGNEVGQEQHFHEITSTGFSLPSNGTGVLLNDRDTNIFVTATGGSFTPFVLTSVDVASALGNNPAVGLTITGYLSGLMTGSIVVNPLGTGYTNVSGAALGSIDYLVFDGIDGGGGFVLDNLSIDEATAPEPASLLLLGIGGAALARIRRRAVRSV